jgi:hypothetical protein
VDGSFELCNIWLCTSSDVEVGFNYPISIKKLVKACGNKDVSGPTCRRLQATHINLLSNLINPAEVCRHLFIMLQNPAGFRGRKIILLQAPAEAHLAVGAPRRPCLFSLSPCGPAATRRTCALVSGAAEEADARGAVAVAVRRRRASCAHRPASNLARLGTATEAGRSPASASARPGARRAANVGGRQISPGLDCDEIGEVADLGLDTN